MDYEFSPATINYCSTLHLALLFTDQTGGAFSHTYRQNSSTQKSWINIRFSPASAVSCECHHQHHYASLVSLYTHTHTLILSPGVCFRDCWQERKQWACSSNLLIHAQHRLKAWKNAKIDINYCFLICRLYIFDSHKIGFNRYQFQQVGISIRNCDPDLLRTRDEVSAVDAARRGFISDIDFK